MLFIFGTHRFGIKRYAYKYMICSHCEMPRLYIQSRGFAWGHIFWIPLIPLGYQYNWHCSACAKNDNPLTIAFIIKLLLLIPLVFIFYMIVFGEGRTSLGESAIWWQLGVGVLLSWSLYETLSHFKKKKERKYRGMFPLTEKKYCAICNGRLRKTKKGKRQCTDCKCFALDLE